MENNSLLINMLKATRIERALIPVSFILLTAAFANRITIDVIILIICSTLLYISGGILNAKIDKDLKLKHTKSIIITLIISAIILSLYNIIILISVIIWTILSIIYNRYSRKVLLADSIILSITHSIIPIIATSVILNLDTILTIKITIFSFILMNFIIPTKNFKGIKEDKARSYKTLITKFRNGRVITIILFNLSIVPLLIAPLILNLNSKYNIVLIPIIALYILANYLILNKNEIKAYSLARLIVLVISFAIIYSATSNIKIISASAAIIFIYSIYLIKK